MGLSVSGVLTGVLVMIGGFTIFLIMLQEGKGGGLASLGGTKAAGIEGVTNPIRRATAWMIGMFFVLAVVLATINRPPKTSDFYDTQKGALEAAVIEPATSTTQPAMTGVSTAAPVTMPTVSVTQAPAVKAVEVPKTNATVTTVEATKSPETVKPAAPSTTIDPVKPVDVPKTDALKPVEPVKTDAPATETPKTETK